MKLILAFFHIYKNQISSQKLHNFNGEQLQFIFIRLVGWMKSIRLGCASRFSSFCFSFLPQSMNLRF